MFSHQVYVFYNVVKSVFKDPTSNEEPLKKSSSLLKNKTLDLQHVTVISLL